jgi:hypothetical protein
MAAVSTAQKTFLDVVPSVCAERATLPEAAGA